MKEDYKQIRSASQQELRHGSRVNSRAVSPSISRQDSLTSLRSHSRPGLHRHRSSLADIAREHKQQSRNSSTNDTRKFFITEEDSQYDQDYEDETNDEFIFLPHQARGGRFESPEHPNFLYRTGSRVFTTAGLELGESRHNSPVPSATQSASHSIVNSRDASSDEEDDLRNRPGSTSSTDSEDPDRTIYLRLSTGTDSSDEEYNLSYDQSETRSFWYFVAKDVLGFDLEKPRDLNEKRRRREKSSGIFDPALALALIAAVIR